MSSERFFWVMQPQAGKLLILAILGLVVLSAIRLGRLAHRLYWAPGRGIRTNGLEGELTKTETLIASAITGQMRAPQGQDSDELASRANREKAERVLKRSDRRFQSLWERHNAELASIRRLCGVIALLSFTTVLCTATQTFNNFFNNSNRTGAYSLFLTLEELFRTLTIGLSSCAAIYLVSASLERTLADRKAHWTESYLALYEQLTRE